MVDNLQSCDDILLVYINNTVYRIKNFLVIRFCVASGMVYLS